MGGVRKLLRGNYNPTGKRKRHPNLQWVTLEKGKRIKVCASCQKRDVREYGWLKKKLATR